MKKTISAEVVWICDQNRFQQVGQVKASNQEVDWVADLKGDQSQ